MVSIGPVSSEYLLGRPRTGISVAHSLSPAISPARHRDTQALPLSPQPSISSSSSKSTARRLALSVITPHGSQLKKDARPQSSSALAKDAMETPRRSFFRRKSRTFRRQTSELNLADTFHERDQSPSLSRRHRSRPSELHDVLRKKEISEPYDFQHITHTSQGHFTSLAQANTNDLATELSIVKASQRPESGLKGIRAAYLNNHPRSRGRDIQRTPTGPPETPKTRTTLPVVPRSRLQPGTWAGSSTRPASTATSPDIPEPSSEIIDALLGMHSTTEPVRSDFYAQQMETQGDRARDLPKVDLVDTFNSTSFNETPPCDMPIVTNTAYDKFRGLADHSEEEILKIAAEDAVDPRHVNTIEAPSATAPGVPTGPFSKMNDAHRDIHLEFRDPKWGSTTGSPVLNAFNDEIKHFSSSDSKEKVFDDHPPVIRDPGIGVAISTDDATWKWEDDIDFVYESPGNENPTFNWWHSSLDAMQFCRSGNHDRETFLSSSVSSVADDDTTGPSTASTSLIESGSTTCGAKDRNSNASDSSLDASNLFDALYEQSTKRLSLTATNRSKSQDYLNTSKISPNPRRNQSSASGFNSMPDLVHSRTTRKISDENQKAMETSKKSSSQKPALTRDASAIQKERIFSVQPSPPPPIALPPIPTNARQCQKALIIQCNLDKKFPSLVETHPGEETPPLAPSGLSHRKTVCGTQLKNGNRRRGSSVNRHAANASVNGPPKRRMSYSIFPTRDKIPPCAVPSVPSQIPCHKPTAVE